MKRILIGAVVGGLIVFLWSAFSHMVLASGAGLESLPNEDAVLERLKDSIPEAGLYFFPGMDMSGKATPEQEAAWEAKYRSGPTGLLVYRPKGGAPLSARLLLIELLTNILAAVLAAYLVSRMVGPYWQRAVAIALMGLFAWFSLSTSYWNWYGFPGSFILAEGADQTVGWLLAGLGIARIVPSPMHAT